MKYARGGVIFAGGFLCGWLMLDLLNLFRTGVEQTSMLTPTPRIHAPRAVIQDTQPPPIPAIQVKKPVSPIRTVPSPEPPPDAPRSITRRQQSAQQKITSLLAQGRYTDAVGVYETRCTETEVHTNCRYLLLNSLAQLWREDRGAHQQLLKSYLALEPHDRLARFYNAMLSAERGRVRAGLAELLDLRHQPDVELDTPTIEKTVTFIVDKHIVSLSEEGKEQALLDFIAHMIEIDNSEQRYPYLLGRAQYRMGRELEALKTLSAVEYAAHWGEYARQIIHDIKQRYVQKRADQQRNEQRLAQQRQRQQRFRIPLGRVGEHFLVDARIDGNTPLRLIVDTGASITSLDHRAIRTSAPAIRHISVQTAGGIRSAQIHRVNHFSVNDVGVPSMEIALMDLSALSNADGLLGMNYLRRFDFYIDQDESILYLRKRRAR